MSKDAGGKAKLSESATNWIVGVFLVLIVVALAPAGFGRLACTFAPKSDQCTSYREEVAAEEALAARRRASIFETTVFTPPPRPDFTIGGQLDRRTQGNRCKPCAPGFVSAPRANRPCWCESTRSGAEQTTAGPQQCRPCRPGYRSNPKPGSPCWCSSS